MRDSEEICEHTRVSTFESLNCIVSVENFQICMTISILSDCLPAYLPAHLPIKGPAGF